mmetsp:Transcript_21369/g.43944  ORF Transcript_21369/g.43944 Transcript_21369/m.43944 type:complete len:81 (-) Transcript_21369:1717-1959(-)
MANLPTRTCTVASNSVTPFGTTIAPSIDHATVRSHIQFLSVLQVRKARDQIKWLTLVDFSHAIIVSVIAARTQNNTTSNS